MGKKYITYDEILGYFPDLNERLQGGKITQLVIERWLEDATNIIDLYLSKRYSLPLEKNSPLVVTICKELFEYFDCKDRYTPSFGGEVDTEKWLEKRYNRLIKLLEQIASGQYALYDEDGVFIVPDPQKVVSPSTNQETEPIFKITKEPVDWEVPEGYAGEE